MSTYYCSPNVEIDAWYELQRANGDDSTAVSEKYWLSFHKNFRVFVGVREIVRVRLKNDNIGEKVIIVLVLTRLESSAFDTQIRVA